DNTGPTVTLVDPTSGAISVPRNVVVRAVFSEPVDPATVNFYLYENGNGRVPPAMVTVAVDRMSVDLVPAAALERNPLYVAYVSFSDLTGQAGAANWTFTTSDVVDVTPPSVVSLSPDPTLATGAPTNTVVFARLSEPILAASVRQDAITV